MLEYLLSFISSPLGGVVTFLCLIAIAIGIYIGCLKVDPICTCPRITMRRQDGTRHAVRIRHLPTCGARHD